MRPAINFDNIILFAIFLSPFSYMFTYMNNLADIRIVELLWVFIFIAVFIKAACNKKLLLSKSSLRIDKQAHAVFILYIAVIFITCLFSVNINRSIKEILQYIYLFLIMYTVYNKAKEPAFFKKTVRMFLLSNILLVAICIASYISGRVIIPSFYLLPDGRIYANTNLFSTNTLMESGTEVLRLNGVLGLGATAIANQVLIQSLFVNYMIRVTSGKRKVFFYILLSANFLTMIFTYSRAGLLVLLVVHLLSVMSGDHVKNIAIVIAAVLACGIFFSLFSNVQERILETFNTQEQSSRYHFAIWLIALKTGYTNIFTGIGLGNMAFSYDAFRYEFYRFGLAQTDSVNVHNFLLQIWAEQGLFGVAANFMLIFGPIISCLRCKIFKLLSAERKIYDFAFLAFIATLTHNLTNNNFYIEIFWVLAGMIYSARDYFYEAEKGGDMNRKYSAFSGSKGSSSFFVTKQASSML
ncbi:O-antigen ligase [Ruminiclostridium sufflavum DSM 19573]|uniref:O-antigen ligase n=1 Tax=Ruminiclostridium sufflavum DSM 19573 TaxID=1121337 RepID=A0A318XSE5_9FIRM|nr:O-antigen ligase family protein [Ruminiclostridium sufflavum]PYG89494.1 O-antigen ligase [Ruminiclostridium sufflavum DSM 19573]